ncbi:MAG: TRAP transporter small permease [Betaproteobacteria bacterium HGW-Betaproteobacteria-13]|jgi:TRAP-type C4-dicarboxylate transport system permease small subunit|uniref:TRAP transporter small permease protein n=1 Tax=Parazoarcus communis TaxID=41977 RepID=A0A2U8H0V7_9RHOO|nr:TRAP transporter small permease [Parazoarcus communis]AWI79298.1 DctQ-like TRAP transporter subunit [Parazoarcus communis]PKO81956.1 MAG: TRAP transporter small permease [Betaproteobacteria bacterium HGW-Betaproteobacteria-13]
MSLTALAQRMEGIGRRLNRVVEWLCAGLIAVMVLVVWLGVGGRYFTQDGISWTEELSRYLMIWAALLAVSCGAWWREHVGLDLIPSRLPETARRFLKLATDGLTVGFFVFMFIYGIDMTLEGRTQFSTLFGMTMEVPFAAVPVSSALAAFQFGVRLLTDFVNLPRAETAAVPY